MPASAVMVRLTSSISMRRFMRFMSIMMPPLMGSAPPCEPEPPPQMCTGIL